MTRSTAEQFKLDCVKEVDAQGSSKKLQALSRDWFDEASRSKYSYHFEWMGRPIIQFPQDIVAMQEIIWRVRPDLIIETGIAHGGSLIFYASMLELLGRGTVIGIDVDIREHNRSAIEAHPMAKRIALISGSSVDPGIVNRVKLESKSAKNILVVLDSNHTHAHVSAELDAYTPLVSVGSYCVVMDTVIENMPPDAFPDRPWSVGNNPRTAVAKFLETNHHFETDIAIDNKLLISVAPGGYLRRVS
jgi:cephalosporin hydroxylase